jgi:glycosyltransferase involved in cell wall biosynthesis
MARVPLVSICIPTYNMAHFLGGAAESVLAQTEADLELVVCDDGSTDGTADLCRELARDSRVRYVRTAGRSGQSGIFNRCHREARGDYVTLLHADDLLFPRFVEDRIRRLRDAPGDDYVFGAVVLVDAVGARTGVQSPWSGDRRFARGELTGPLLMGCLLSPPSLMIRRACLDQVGPFREDLTWGLDWEWDLRLAERCAGAYASEPLAGYRIHEGSGTAQELAAARNGAQERTILAATLARQPSGAIRRRHARQAYRSLSRRHMYFADQALRRGSPSVARSNLWFAMLADGFLLSRPTLWLVLAASFGVGRPWAWYQRMRHRDQISDAVSPSLDSDVHGRS